MTAKGNKKYRKYFIKPAAAKEKPLEKRLMTDRSNMICIPEGYAMSDYLDMDDSVVGEGEKPHYMKEVHVVFE